MPNKWELPTNNLLAVASKFSRARLAVCATAQTSLRLSIPTRKQLQLLSPRDYVETGLLAGFSLLRGWELNPLPLGYEPNEQPLLLPAICSNSKSHTSIPRS